MVDTPPVIRKESFISSRVNLEQIQITKRAVFFTHLASFFGGLPNPTVRSRGRQVTFAKILDNKGFIIKLLKNF